MGSKTKKKPEYSEILFLLSQVRASIIFYRVLMQTLD